MEPEEGGGSAVLQVVEGHLTVELGTELRSPRRPVLAIYQSPRHHSSPFIPIFNDPIIFYEHTGLQKLEQGWGIAHWQGLYEALVQPFLSDFSHCCN